MTIQALVTYFGILYQQENIAPGNIDINTLKKNSMILKCLIIHGEAEGSS